MTTSTISLNRENASCSSGRSKQLPSTLPPRSTLQTWVHRPQAIAKCFVSDVYSLRALVSAEVTLSSYASRDVFLLNRFPCKNVELVSWVAGVDHKESSMVITLDDGDGLHVLPVNVRLPLVTIPSKVVLPPTRETDVSSHFLSARERKAARRKAPVPPPPPVKAYARKDVRVGDTVRVIGRVDEWQRRKATGAMEWVRQVIVEEGAGGSITVVEPEEGHHHATAVCGLHETLYAKHFCMPAPPAQKQRLGSALASPQKSLTMWSDGIEMSSEVPSELGVGEEDLKLRDPSHLRPSQLTDRTFRQYLLDYLTQETIRRLRSTSAAGPSTTRAALERIFPEYCPADKGQSKASARVFGPTHRDNTPDTKTPRTFRSKTAKVPALPVPAPTPRPTRAYTPAPVHTIQPFSIASLLLVPHLAELATLVVDSEARKEERRRRRRIRDEIPKAQDLAIEAHRRERGIDPKEWKMSDDERLIKMSRLVGWVIRNVAEEGSLVQVKFSGTEYGYLPLPAQLLLPLLIPHLETERFIREHTFVRKTDPRRGNGMSVSELVGRLREWGEEGRWERVGEWKVEEAIEWGEESGLVQRVGKGWWAVQG